MQLILNNDDGPLHELLQLIDEVYAPDASARARERRGRAATRREALRAQAAKLQNVLQSRSWSRRLYPFKLSSVADEVWHSVQEHIPAHPLAQDEFFNANTTVELRKPFGRAHVRGTCALRCVYTHDGGVFVACVTTMHGTECDNNLMAGLTMHETTWVRMVRADPSNAKSPVLVESVTESEIFTDGTDRLGRGQLRRFRDYMERYMTGDREAGGQKLENRLLDASLSQRNADCALQRDQRDFLRWQ